MTWWPGKRSWLWSHEVVYFGENLWKMVRHSGDVFWFPRYGFHGRSQAMYIHAIPSGHGRVLYPDGSGWVLEDGEWRAETAPGRRAQ